MAPRLILLMSSGSKEEEPRYTCLSEAKASHWQRMWAEVSSSAPHLLHSGLSDSHIRWRCLLRVLCPVRRPVTALHCVLLKDRNLALAPRKVPEINSLTCLWVSPRPHKMPEWVNSCISKFRAVLTNLIAVTSRTVCPIYKRCNGLQSWEGERNYGQAHTLCRPEFAQVKKNALLGDKYFINLIFAVLIYLPGLDGHLSQKHIYLQSQLHDKLSQSRGVISIPHMRKHRLSSVGNNQSQTTNHSCIHTTEKEIQDV
jgi:hypothetical protein